MSAPRNRKAYRRGQRHRAEIKRAWLELLREQPFEPVTAAAIAARLPACPLTLIGIRWHMARIRAEAAVAAATECADAQAS